MDVSLGSVEIVKRKDKMITANTVSRVNGDNTSKNYTFKEKYF